MVSENESLLTYSGVFSITAHAGLLMHETHPGANYFSFDVSLSFNSLLRSERFASSYEEPFLLRDGFVKRKRLPLLDVFGACGVCKLFFHCVTTYRCLLRPSSKASQTCSLSFGKMPILCQNRSSSLEQKNKGHPSLILLNII